jgi:hypothetical protein
MCTTGLLLAVSLPIGACEGSRFVEMGTRLASTASLAELDRLAWSDFAGRGDTFSRPEKRHNLLRAEGWARAPGTLRMQLADLCGQVIVQRFCMSSLELLQGRFDLKKWTELWGAVLGFGTFGEVKVLVGSDGQGQANGSVHLTAVNAHADGVIGTTLFPFSGAPTYLNVEVKAVEVTIVSPEGQDSRAEFSLAVSIRHQRSRRGVATTYAFVSDQRFVLPIWGEETWEYSWKDLALRLKRKTAG